MCLSSFVPIKRKPTHFPPLQPAGSDCSLQSPADGASQPKGWQPRKDASTDGEAGLADITDALWGPYLLRLLLHVEGPATSTALRWKIPLGAYPKEIHRWKHPWVTEIWGVLLLKLTNSWKLTLYKATVLSIQLRHTHASSVQLLNGVWLFVTPWTTARQASLSITNSRSLLKLMSIESVMPSSHLILCCPLLLLPSVFPSIRVFSFFFILFFFRVF